MQEYTEESVLKELGLNQLPAPRLKGLDKAPPSGSSMIKWKMAVALIDTIETGAFERYIPDWIEIDQSIDPRSFDPDTSRALSVFTDIPIETIPEKIRNAIGLTLDGGARNHYIMLANDISRYVVELGAAAVSPIHVFRTNGAEGHRPILGAVFKLSYRIPDGQTRYDIGSNLGLLTERQPEIHLDENETIKDVA